MAEPRIIRKYANRRLYDTETSKHINLADVRKLISGGIDIRVIEDTSGEDITRSILLQLVSEQELGGQPVLSDNLLMQIIRYYDHPMQGMLGAYLQQGFEVFLEQQKTLQQSMRDMMQANPFTAFQDLASQGMENWMAMQKSFMQQGGKKDDDDGNES